MQLGGIIIDIFLVFIALIQVITYTKRGFVKTLLIFLQVIVCFTLSIVFSPALGEIISNNISLNTTISNILAYILIFAISFIASNIVIYFVDKPFNNHVFNTINKTLGFVLGLIFSLINLLIVCSIITSVIGILNFISPEISASALRNNTIIYRFISNLDIINLLYSIS